MPVSSHAQPLHPAPGRRTVVRGLAWSVPTVTLATAAPAFAVSPRCFIPVDVVWNSLQYTRISATEGRFTSVDPDGPGPMQPLVLTVRQTFLGSNTRAGGQSGSSENLAVRRATVGGQSNPLVIHQSPIYDHLKSYERLDRNKSTTTFTFDRPVSDLRFTITDIDSQEYDFTDAVGIESTSAFTTSKVNGTSPYGVNGTGTMTDPWRPFNYNNPIADSETRGNGTVTFTEDVTSFSIHYWNQAYTSSDVIDGDQRIFLSNLSLTYNACP